MSVLLLKALAVLALIVSAIAISVYGEINENRRH